MQTRIVSFFIAVLSVLIFSSAQADSLSPEQQAYLESKGNTLRFAYNGNFTPLEFADDQGEAAGVTPDVVRWMAARFGFEVEFFAATQPQIIEGVINGTYDAACNLFPSVELTNDIALTQAMLELPIGIFVPAQSSLNNWGQLNKGVLIGIEQDSSFGLIQENNLYVSTKWFDHFSAMLDATCNSEVDGMVCFELSILHYVREGFTSAPFRMVGPPLITLPACMAVQKENRILLSILQQGVEEAYQAGVFRWVMRKWVGDEKSRGIVVFLVHYRNWITFVLCVLLVALLLFWLWDIRLTIRVQKQTAQLRRSEERLRSIFQNSPDAIFIEDENGIILDANPVACEFHRMSHGKLIGKNVLDLVPPEERETVKNQFKKWFTGELKRYEGFSLAGTGQKVPVEVIGTPLQYEGVSAVLLLVRDITDRQRAEVALRQSEARYRGLIETQSSFVVRINEDGNFTFVNEAFCRFVGQSRGELIGASYQVYVYDEDLEELETKMARLLSRQDRMMSIEHRMRVPSHIAWVQWENQAIFDEHGNIVEIQSVGRDVTERRRILTALEESERRMRFLFEKIPHIAVQGYNPNHEVIFWNQASEKLYGYSKRDAFGRPIEELLFAKDQQSLRKEIINTWVETGEAPIPSEMIKVNASGEPVSVYSSYLGTLNANGEREMYVIDIDLSELKRASQELVKAKNEAERANRAKSEFLANMSHEIRTPMNGVMGMTTLLLDTELDAEQRDHVQTIMDSTKELLTIIDELLDISRIEAGEVRLQNEPFSPRETVEKVRVLFAERAARREVELSVAIHPDVPARMLGDAGRLRQILINLVGNAMKFTHDGHIQIRMQAEEKKDHWNLLCDVKDTGVGMTPEMQERVFDKFTQGDASSTREHGGAGLGMAITRQLIELMGGRIRVSSKLGSGTTFEFNVRLPKLKEEKKAIAAQDKTLTEDRQFNAQILLVEDNLVNQKVAIAMLKKQGCVVSVAPNGAEALNMLAENTYDLIFMDCQMPIMDGFEATRAIRQLSGAVRDIPIVAMTAHALKEDRERCISVGMDDYLSKPVHRDKLRAVIEKYCG